MKKSAILQRARRMWSLRRAYSLRQDFAALCELRADEKGRGKCVEEAVLVHPRALRGRPALVRLRTTDWTTLKESFVYRYHVPPAALTLEIRSILDLGANVGYTAAEMAMSFPKAALVAVEMDPENYRYAEMNTQCIGPRVRCVNAAVWIHDRGVAYDSDRECDAYCVQEGCVESPDAVVRSMTPEQLLDLLPGGEADFVKMDIEGAEAEVLRRGRVAWLSRIKSLNVEIHDVADIDAIRDVLEDAGFVVRRSTRHWSALEAWRPIHPGQRV